MTALPPILALRPSRRPAPGRPAVARSLSLACAIALAVAGCGTRPAEPSLAAASPSAEAPPAIDSLLVATGGALQVTNADGSLIAFDGPAEPVVEASAARGRVIAIDATGHARLSAEPAGGARVWQQVQLAAEDAGDRSLLALSPIGTHLALLRGAPQGEGFDLVVRDPTGPESRAIPVARGLDGPPVWIGPSIVAIHVIRDNQRSGFAFIDLATDAVRDVPSYGVALNATADGGVVAFDEATTGDVLVGSRVDMTDAGLERLVRIAGPAGSGVDRVALDGAGTRLAIARRVADGTTVEILAAEAGSWRSVRTLSIPGDRVVAITWLR
jgi:hypothetical protein